MLGILTASAGVRAETVREVTWLLCPVVVLGLAFKVQRLTLHPSDFGLLRGFPLLTGEVLAYLGLGLLTLGWLRLSRHLGAPRLGLVCAQLGVMGWLAVSAVAHRYYVVTGFTLDYELLSYWGANAAETVEIAASEAGGPVPLLLVAGLVATAVGPWFLRRRAVLPPAAPRAAPGHPFREGAVCLTLGLSLVLVSLLPSGLGLGRSFFREPTVALVASGLDAHFRPAPYSGRETDLRPVGPSGLVPGPGAGSLNLVVVVLESTRASGTSLYGESPATTPFLAALARQSAVVQRAYAVVPHTSKALVAVLCGFEPAPALDVIGSRKGGMAGRCLPDLLAEQGYATAYFQAPKKTFERRPKLVKNMGFERFWSGDMTKQEGLKKINYFGYGDEVMVEPTRAWLAEEAKEPFFAAYLTSNTHHPYGLPEQFEEQRYSKNKKLNAYLNTIRSTDEVLERLMNLYREAGLWERTVFVVVGDHGEAFGEHGLKSHDNVMYDEGIRVPLLFRVPGREASLIPGPLNQLAIAPTALDLLGYGVTGGDYLGESAFKRAAEPVLFATCYQSAHCAAMIRGDKKLIYHFGDRPPLLFDLKADPGERRNLASSHPGEVQRLSRETEDWRLALRQTHREPARRRVARYVSQTPQDAPESVDAVFGGLIALRSVELVKGEVRRGHRAKLRYFFEALRPVPPRYRLRVRATGRGQRRYFDHVPVRGLYPLREWQPGDYIEDLHRLKVRESWKGETMDLCLELVDEHERPLPVTGGPGQTCVPLGRVSVLPK